MKKKHILIINGPNLNLLGKRDPVKYGTLTFEQINNQLVKLAKSFEVTLEFFQSNCEGTIIDFLQRESSRTSDGILINPGALTHYGFSLKDALLDTQLPIIEVHLSDITKREDFRKIDIIKDICLGVVMGYKEKSYLIGLDRLIKYLKRKR